LATQEGLGSKELVLIQLLISVSLYSQLLIDSRVCVIPDDCSILLYLFLLSSAELMNIHFTLKTVSLCVAVTLIRDFSSFTESSNVKSSPSARCTSATNSICLLLRL
jgi:uncharacterized membrane protein YfhO